MDKMTSKSRTFYNLQAASSTVCYFIINIEDVYGSTVSRCSGDQWDDIFVSRDDLQSAAVSPSINEIVISKRLERSITFLDTGSTEMLPKAPPESGGAINNIRGIGLTLYACGFRGQVYRRDAPGAWQLLSPSALTDSANLTKNCIFYLDGPSENEIYMAGDEGCLFWNGSSIVPIGPKTSQLTGVFVESERKIWLCGWEGVLMRGNYIDGFKLVPNDERQMFLSVAMADGRVFLGSTESFWGSDGRSISAVQTGLDPIKIHRLSAVEGTVWAIGDNVVLRYAAGAWARLI